MNQKIDSRMSQILQFTINEYINTGEPVGSRTLAKKYNLNVSPATIRNIMSDLEDVGYLFQPYTSAGRIPTKEGLKYYVDTLILVRNIPEELKVRFLKSVKNEELKLSQICSKISGKISEITNCIGVVLIPDIKVSSIKHVEFVKLNEARLLIVIVNELGQVQNKILKIDFDISQEELNKFSNFLNDKFKNMSIFDIKNGILKEIEKVKNIFGNKISMLINKFSKIEWTDSQNNKDIILKGFRNIMDSDYFKKDIESLKKLLTLFEEKNKVLEMIEQSIKSPGIQIFIGSQSKEFENLSFITSSYSKNGIILGSLGVIGPLRMDYNKVIPIVDCASQIITSILDENFRRLN